MKKILSLVLAVALLLCAATAMADVKLGQVDFAAHGTSCFAVMTVAVDGDTIVAAKIDEFQFMDAATAEGVPNSDASFGANFPEGKVLASKVKNAELYSNNMATKAGATQTLDSGYAAIEGFVTGKTVAELEVFVATNTSETAVAAVDAVSSCTLVDTLGYIKGLLAAARTVAATQTGVYTVYNQTGEVVTAVTITSNETGDSVTVAENMAPEACEVVTFTLPAELNGHNCLTFAYTTESGRSEAFVQLSIETAPIQLLSQEGIDAMTNATVIKFAVPVAE